MALDARIHFKTFVRIDQTQMCAQWTGRASSDITNRV